MHDVALGRARSRCLRPPLVARPARRLWPPNSFGFWPTATTQRLTTRATLCAVSLPRVGVPQRLIRRNAAGRSLAGDRWQRRAASAHGCSVGALPAMNPLSPPWWPRRHLNTKRGRSCGAMTGEWPNTNPCHSPMTAPQAAALSAGSSTPLEPLGYTTLGLCAPTNTYIPALTWPGEK